MKQRPSINDQNIGVFFGKTKKKKEQNNLTKIVQDKSEMNEVKNLSRQLVYQNKWKEQGKTQISLWLPETIVKAFKIQAIRDNKSSSQFATEIFSEALKKYV